MKTLIAIGGGSFQKQETMSIDTYAISRCGKTQPHVLFIPLASRDDQGYAKRFKQYYRSLGCQVEALRLLHTKLSNEEIYKKFRSQDMIYLGAGDTVFLMKQLKQRKLDLLLKELSQQGIVICGTGIGVSIAANKIKGIRCALCSDPVSAKLTREHNNSNVLAMGQRIIGVELMKEIVRVWVNTEFSHDERHQRRIDKVMALEK